MLFEAGHAVLRSFFVCLTPCLLLFMPFCLSVRFNRGERCVSKRYTLKNRKRGGKFLANSFPPQYAADVCVRALKR